MRRLQTAVLLVAVLIMTSPTWPEDDICHYVHVLDRCGKRVVIMPTGDIEEAHLVALDEGPAAVYGPGGLALATVPGWEQFWAFATQGPYLHVIDYSNYYEDPAKAVKPIRTMGLVEDLGWPEVHLTGVAAGDAITINGKTIYPLYVVGYVPGAITHPYVMIFDQEAVLDGPLLLNKVLMAAGYLDHLDDSGGTAIDVTVGATLDGGHKQVAFASVLSGSGLLVQQFHTITVEDGVGMRTEIEPWNDEGVLFAGSEPDAIGLDYESLGLDASGVFQTSSTVGDLETGAQSCELGPGDLTDVATWGPDPALANQYMQFATASNGSEVGILLGYPEGVCPYSDPPVIRPGALVLPIGSRPLALSLSSRTSNPFWLYTANASGTVTARELFVYSDPTNGDSIAVIGQFNKPLEGCPSAIVFRDEALGECMAQFYGDPPGPRPDPDDPDDPTTKYCRDNPDDPACEFAQKPGD